jgi:hypothetical protein
VEPILATPSSVAKAMVDRTSWPFRQGVRRPTRVRAPQTVGRKPRRISSLRLSCYFPHAPGLSLVPASTSCRNLRTSSIRPRWRTESFRPPVQRDELCDKSHVLGSTLNGRQHEWLKPGAWGKQHERRSELMRRGFALPIGPGRSNGLANNYAMFLSVADFSPATALDTDY